MKLIIKLEILDGERTYSVIEVIDVDDVHIMNAESLNNFGNKYASDYFGCKNSDEEKSNWHYNENGCLAVRLYDIKEVTDEEYEVLKKYI